MKFLLPVLLALVVLLGAAPQPAAATTHWDVAMLIYTGLDASCDGKRVTNRLTQEELDQAVTRAKLFRRRVRTWSNEGGRVRLTFFFPGTVTQATRLSNGYCWVSPSNVVNMGDWPKGFDSVFVQHPRGLHVYGGLSYDGYLPYGSTYSTTVAWPSTVWFWDTGHATRMMVHEWLHAAGGYYRKVFGSSIPNLHNEQAFGFSDSKTWYKAFLAGFYFDGRWYGLTPGRWAYGTPR